MLAVHVLRGQLVEGEPLVQRVDGHLRFYLEIVGHDGEKFDEAPAEGAVSCHDVMHVGMPQSIDQTAYQTVAEVVERSFVFLEIGGGKSVADDHVHAFLDYGAHEHWGVGGVIGAIAVHHQVAVGLYLAEHPPDDIPLPLRGLLADDGTRLFGQGRRPVCGIVVIHEDGRLGQRGPEVAHHAGNGMFLVVARDKYGNGGHGSTVFYRSL